MRVCYNRLQRHHHDSRAAPRVKPILDRTEVKMTQTSDVGATVNERTLIVELVQNCHPALGFPHAVCSHSYALVQRDLQLAIISFLRTRYTGPMLSASSQRPTSDGDQPPPSSGFSHCTDELMAPKLVPRLLSRTLQGSRGGVLKTNTIESLIRR